MKTYQIKLLESWDSEQAIYILIKAKDVKTARTNVFNMFSGPTIINSIKQVA